jgi:hypothetical protein
VADEELHNDHRPGDDREPFIEETSEFPAKHSTRLTWPWMIAGATLVICAIVYFSYDGPSNVDNASATIGPQGSRTVEHITTVDNGRGQVTISHGIASVAATDSSARLLRSSAQKLGILAQDLAAKEVIDADVVANFARAAAETYNAAQAALDGLIVMDVNVMVTLLQRSGAVQRHATAALASREDHGGRQSDTLRQHSLELERIALASQPALETSAVSEVTRASATLNDVARDLGVGDKTDTAVLAGLHRMSFELDRASHLMARGGTIDRVALAGLIQQAREIELQSTSMVKHGSIRVREKLAELERLSAEVQRELATLEQEAAVVAEHQGQ